VYQRGDGNPLFTEALVNLDRTVRTELPWSMRDLLLSAVQDLPEQAQRLVRTAAVGGHRVGHALLAAVTGADDATLTAGLRPAITASVLVSDDDGYAFRHELIPEAVLGDLLPGERAQAHRRFAEALEEAAPWPRADGTAAVQIARHWLGARDVRRALIAAWRATARAGASLAYAEQLLMAEQVLQLWDQVPEPARDTGADHAGVLMLAADAARWAGEPERGLVLVETAIAELEKDGGKDGQTERLASALRRRARQRWELLLPGQLDDLRAALRLAAAPTRARARVIADLCWALRREDQHEEAGRLAAELAGLASRLGDEEFQAEAMMVLAAEGAHRGEDTTAALQGALDQVARIDSGHLETWAYLTASHVLEGRGRHELAIAAGRDGLARALQLGLGRQIAAPIAGNLAESLTSAGRWDEALEIDWRLAAGEPAWALEAARAVPPYGPDTDPRYPWALLATAMRACADASTAGLARGPAEPGRLRADLERHAAGSARRSPLHEAYAATFAAEASRAAGRLDLAGWDAAAAAWQALGQPYPAAYALLRAAAAAASSGDRDGTAGRLRQAAEHADRLAAGPLRQQIGELARRARVPLADPGGGQPAVPFGLTARELEVLRLTAAGRSNREIASEPFISPRTASVHVSNILGKLGVATRGEAAAVAHRRHLFD
jgi:DNA-binding CsgD family transcriptional regulator